MKKLHLVAISLFAVALAIIAVVLINRRSENDLASRMAPELSRPVRIPKYVPEPFEGEPRRAAPAFASHEAMPALPDTPSDQQVAGSRIFPTRLWPIDGTRNDARKQADNAAVAGILRKFNELDREAAFSELDRWLAANQDSRWYPALKHELMNHRFERGFFDVARSGWDELWESLKEVANSNALALGNEVLARLLDTNMGLARSGRMRELVADAEGRPIGGAVEARLLRAKESVWLLEHTGARNVMCGPLALNCIKDYRREPYLRPILGNVSSDHIATGLPLTAVADYAKKDYKLEMSMARRSDPAAPIPTPAVMHLKGDHYAALLERDPESGDYFLEDRTLEFAGWVDSGAVDSMASGYFLLANNAPASGWYAVAAAEGRNVFGRDGAHGMQETGLNVTQDSVQVGDANQCMKGMPTYVFHPMPGSLRIGDEPLGYSPPVGPAVTFKINYNDLDSSQPASAPAFSNVGLTWSTDWVAWVDHVSGTLTSASTVRAHLTGGGVEVSTYDTSTVKFGPNDRSFATITQSGSATYTRELPDGSREIYNSPDNPSSPNRVFLTEKIDPQGNSLTFAYDSNMRLITVTDEIGQVTTLQYNHPTDIFKITSVIDPFGRLASLKYDAAGRLISVTDVIALESTFTYQPTGFIATMTTPYGTTTFEKLEDAAGSLRLLQVTDPLGDIERIQYIDTGSSGSPVIPTIHPPPASVTVAGTSVPFYAENFRLQFRNSFYWSRKAWHMAPGDYKAARNYRWFTDVDFKVTGILEAVKEPHEDRVWFNYPGGVGNAGAFFPYYLGNVGQPEKTLRMLGAGTPQLVQSYYNQIGNPTKRIDPLGRQTEITYAANGVDVLEVRQTTGGANELLAGYTYNAQHLPLTATDAAGQTSNFTYNARGQLLTVSNPKGEVTTYNYNFNGYLLSVDGPLAGTSDTVSYTYDAFGRVQTETAVDGHVRAYSYDAFDRPTRVTYPDGTFEENTYDRLDRVSSKDRLLRQTSYGYNARRQLTSTTDPLGRTTKFDWCRCGALKRLIDPLNRPTLWTYDLQGRVTSKQYADGSQVRFAYESVTSRITSIIDEKNQVKRMTYNLDDTIAAVTYVNEQHPTSDVSYTYDAKYSRLLSMIDDTGSTSYTYHPVVAGTLGAGKLATVDGPLPNDTVARTYDQLGRQTAYAVNGVGEAVTFDALGRVTQAVNPLGTFAYAYVGATGRLNSMTYPGGMTAGFDYHPLTGDFRLKDIIHTLPGGSQLSRHSYVFDAPGQITRWTQVHPAAGVNRSWLLGYDAADQLTSVTAQDPATFANLPTGNFSYTYDPAGNRLTETIDGVTTSASYNPLNQLVSQTGGGAASLPGLTYEWDANDRLFAINYTGTNRRTEFQYDGAGRRRGVIEKDGPTVTEHRRFAWDDLRITEERDATGTAVKRRYFAQGIQVDPGGGLQSRLFAHDHLGSVRSVISGASTVAATVDFDPWGRRTLTSGTEEASLAFTGHWLHGQSALVMAPYRSFAPRQGRWISRDPIQEDGGINLYNYVVNQPLRLRDPTGELPAAGLAIPIIVTVYVVNMVMNDYLFLSDRVNQRFDDVSQEALRIRGRPMSKPTQCTPSNPNGVPIPLYPDTIGPGPANPYNRSEYTGQEAPSAGQQPSYWMGRAGRMKESPSHTPTGPKTISK